VCQDYPELYKQQIKNLYSQRSTTFLLKGKAIDQIKQKNALMPNIIHSLDACLLTRLSLMVKFDMLSIHDCFGSVAADSEALQKAIKTAFVEMYEDRDFIEKFHEGVLKQIVESKPGYSIVDNMLYVPKTGVMHAIPTPPRKGSFKRLDVLNSIYMAGF
jgi:hypothetical protein